MAAPMPWDIPFKSEQHKKVLRECVDRFQMSRSKMSTRYKQWAENEELFRAYIPKAENELTLTEARRQRGEQDYITIEIPYSYAIALSAHTYITSVFLDRDPVFQFQGRHGEAQLQEQSVEAVMAYQLGVGGMLQPLYTWFLDPEKYGVAIIGVYWDEEQIIASEIAPPASGRGKARALPVRQRGYCGNRIYNVRPSDWFPDPRVPFVRFQDGEFCGVRRVVGWNALKKQFLTGELFNEEEARRSFRSGPPREDTLNVRGQETPSEDAQGYLGTPTGVKAFGEIIEMTIELSAKEWHIGGPDASDWPEKWTFTILNRSVVIGARPMGFFHQKFPFAVLEGEIDGYSFNARSTTEILTPLNYTLSWLFNSRFNDVRQRQDGTWIIDPAKINMSSFNQRSRGGRIITVRPLAYGTDVDKVIRQVVAQDSTAQNMQDAQVVVELMQRVSGVTDNVMGAPHPGGRKTATEVRTSSSFSINRLATRASYYSACGFAPLAQMLLQNTQQLYDDTQLFRLVRDTPEKENAFVTVDKEAIAGFYDFIPVDGTLPIDRYQQAHMLMEFFQTILGVPQEAAKYDLSEAMNQFGRLIQVPGLNAIRLKVVPDATMGERAASGQSVPLAGPGGMVPSGATPLPQLMGSGQ